MPPPQLSHGFFQKLFNNEHPNDPILQVLDVHEKDDRFRFRMSDGDQQYSVCVSQSQISDNVRRELLNSGTPVIRITNYTVSLAPDSRTMLIIGGYSVVARCEQIGDPSPIARSNQQHGAVATTSTSIKTNNASAYQQQQSVSPNRPNKVVVNQQQPAAAVVANSPLRSLPIPYPQSDNNGRRPAAISGQQSGFGSINIMPIKMLTPYVNKWKICGLVTAKDDLKEIKTARGDMKVVNFELTDQSGDQIRVAAFGKQAEMFAPIIQMQQMYYLSNGTVKPANKRFNSTGHDYELTLRDDSELVPCTDKVNIAAPKIKYRFVKLSQLKSYVGQAVDVIGIIKSVDPVTSITKRDTNQSLDKRDIHIVDDTNTLVTVTLWAEKARDFDASSEHSSIAIKGAVVREFQGGTSLSIGMSTKFELHPDCTESYNLKSWYDKHGTECAPTSISRTATGAGTHDLRLIGIAEAIQLGKYDEKGVYFNVKAMISTIKTESALYKGCVSDKCRKKVVEMDGQYRCEKCNITADTFKYCLLLSAEMADLTGTYWITMFEETAEKLLGASAKELGEMQQMAPDNYNALMIAVYNKPFIFRVRAKGEIYNDEQKLKWVAYGDIKSVAYEEYCSEMKKTIAAIQKN